MCQQTKTRWWRRPERGPPQGAKTVEAERADALDLGLDGVAIE
jgi:hypothetical protein